MWIYNLVMTTEQEGRGRRRTLTREKVITGALEIVDEGGWDALSMASLSSRLGIVAASLYNHVRNLDDVRSAVQIAAMTDLGIHLRNAAMGRSGLAGLRALMDEHRSWATTNRYRYQALTMTPNDPHASMSAALDVNEAVRAMLLSCGIPQRETFGAAVGLFAAMHGFAALVNTNFIGAELDQDRIYEAVARGALAGIEASLPQPT